MTERRNANLFEVLICQIRQNDKADVVLGKALRVLPEAELLQPLSYLLHRGSAPQCRASSTRCGKITRQRRSAVGSISLASSSTQDAVPADRTECCKTDACRRDAGRTCAAANGGASVQPLGSAVQFVGHFRDDRFIGSRRGARIFAVAIRLRWRVLWSIHRSNGG